MKKKLITICSVFLLYSCVSEIVEANRMLDDACERIENFDFEGVDSIVSKAAACQDLQVQQRADSVQRVLEIYKKEFDIKWISENRNDTAFLGLLLHSTKAEINRQVKILQKEGKMGSYFTSNRNSYPSTGYYVEMFVPTKDEALKCCGYLDFTYFNSRVKSIKIHFYILEKSYGYLDYVHKMFSEKYRGYNSVNNVFTSLDAKFCYKQANKAIIIEDKTKGGHFGYFTIEYLDIIASEEEKLLIDAYNDAVNQVNNTKASDTKKDI